MNKIWLFIEAIYITYMLVFFKTKVSFHLPLEKNIQNSLSTLKFCLHPINTGIYENKVCFLGHLFAYFIIIWNLIRYINQGKLLILNNIIWIIALILSVIMNPNVTIYLLPVFIGELLFNILGKNLS